MHLVPVNEDTVRVGQPLPFALMDKDGVLLARKSFIIASRDALADFARRGGGLYIDASDSETHLRAYVEQLHVAVRKDKPLGEIANTKLSADSLGGRRNQDGRADWLDLQVQANSILRDARSVNFMERLERLCAQLSRHSQSNPDGTLFALIHLSATEVHKYSATHAMLVSVMCGLAAREVLSWSEPRQLQLCKAALTMNLSMTDLQDRLALQAEALTTGQRAAIDAHAAKSVEMLTALGVTDEVWLEAVHDHHTQKPGALSEKSSAQQLARLIQRADMFAARLAPRASRQPLSPAAAMQACYFDEVRAIDEAGAALIKAVGIYQPGSYVRLTTDEVAVVVKRGLNTTTPRVAVVVNRNGLPTVEPLVRDTSVREYRVVASVAHRDMKVKINLERMLALTAAPSDRTW
ncbi:MAG: phosphohydrolase [Burkholderiales bacterium]|nr:phosphohydrolase [Burkholderiales bacterium]